MAFDVGAGIAAMGEQVAKVTGLAALEQQKSGLENERLKLANDLATTRESKGRQESHVLDMEKLDKSQTFQASEGDKTRATQLESARIHASTAGASAAAHLQGIREQIAFQQGQPDYKVSDDGTLLSIPKQSKDASGKVVPSTATPVAGADGKPIHVANPEKAQAVAKLVEVTKDQLTNTTRLYETDVKQVQAELAAALKTPGAMIDPTKDAGVIEAKKALDAVRQRYEPTINTLNKRLDGLYSDLGVKAGRPGSGQSGYDWSKYTKGGGAPAPAAPDAPSAGGGLINNF